MVVVFVPIVVVDVVVFVVVVLVVVVAVVVAGWLLWKREKASETNAFRI